MKLGFYIDSLVGDEHNVHLFNQLNKAVEDGVVEDACVFYNKIDFNPVRPKFGLFNSTDIWNFTGTLITTTTQNTLTALGIVNNFALYYLFDRDKDFVGLLRLPSSVPILTRKASDADYVYRTTGREPILIDENLSISDLIGYVGEGK